MNSRITAKSSRLELDSIESIESFESFAALEHGERVPGANAMGKRSCATGEDVPSEYLPGEYLPGEADRSVEGLGIAILLVFQGAIFFAIGFIVAKWTH